MREARHHPETQLHRVPEFGPRKAGRNELHNEKQYECRTGKSLRRWRRERQTAAWTSPVESRRPARRPRSSTDQRNLHRSHGPQLSWRIRETKARAAAAGVPDSLRPTLPPTRPLPPNEDATSRIFAFVDDLFFQAKIQETARKLNVKVEFVKSEKDMLERIKLNGEEKPSLVIFDMNNVNAKPLTLIPKLKSKLKKTSIIGFLSHVQGDLKQKAHEVGCDMVLPRSAFSQNLPQLLRRHGAPEDEATG